MEKDEVILNIPDAKTVPCVTCKYGMINFLAMYCAKYKVKPSDVYYENAQCEKYSPIDK